MPDLVRIAAHGPGPLLVHCAAGKDRTGVTVAVLLAVAGVPREVVAANYLATNHVLDRLDGDPVGWCVDQGVDPDDVVRWQCRMWAEHPWW